MAWLVDGERVLASVERPTSRRGKAMGLIGRDSFEGVMCLEPCRSVHTFGMRFPIDVAFVDDEGTVLSILTVPPRRVTMPRPRSRCVLEARAGSFERWGVTAGTTLEITR